ncbi:MAG: succinate dehydrogenase, cytochrome b556 subunit [Anaerolineales bacterium]|jgi:succinate dehydrogenase / fumarate reductase cytochrome b subunit
MATPAKTQPNSPRNFLKWFDIRWRDSGMWAFALNRLTAIGLVFYLFLHLGVLSTLAQGPEAYGSFLQLIKSPVFVFGEFLVVIAGLYHGLNGIRIVLTSFGIAVPYQKQLFYVLFLLAVAGSVIFGIRMFTV